MRQKIKLFRVDNLNTYIYIYTYKKMRIFIGKFRFVSTRSVLRSAHGAAASSEFLFSKQWLVSRGNGSREEHRTYSTLPSLCL